MKYCKCKEPMKLVRSSNGDYLACVKPCKDPQVHMPVPPEYYDEDIDSVVDRGRD